eukprot:2959185-Pyramimonas_sp.AAC.1
MPRPAGLRPASGQRRGETCAVLRAPLSPRGGRRCSRRACKRHCTQPYMPFMPFLRSAGAFSQRVL